MSSSGYILGSIVLIIVLLGINFIKSNKKALTPTQGQKINSYQNPGKALLVIDVQDGLTKEKGKKPPIYKGADDKIPIINKLIKEADDNNMLVAYIRHEFPDNLLTRLLDLRVIKGLPGTQLDTRVLKINNNDFSKNISDSFSNPQLEELLIRHEINELYLVGLDAGICIYNTAMGAKNRGYKVQVVEDGVMTRKKMEDVLTMYQKDGITTTLSNNVAKCIN